MGSAGQRIAASVVKPAVKTPMQAPMPTMGPRGPSLSLGGGSSGGRQYTPNPFMGSPTAQSMAPPAPQGMGPPQQIPPPQMGPPQGMPMSAPKMAPQGMAPPPQQAMIAALRNRSGRM